MKNKLTVTALLLTLIYASNGFSVYQSNLKKSNSILVGPDNELISLEEHMKEIDINVLSITHKRYYLILILVVPALSHFCTTDLLDHKHLPLI